MLFLFANFPTEWGQNRNVARTGRQWKNRDFFAPLYSIIFYLFVILGFYLYFVIAAAANQVSYERALPDGVVHEIDDIREEEEEEKQKAAEREIEASKKEVEDALKQNTAAKEKAAEREIETSKKEVEDALKQNTAAKEKKGGSTATRLDRGTSEGW